MTERFALSPNALNNLSAYLPSSLTQQQVSKVIEAARMMAQCVWEEGRISARTERMILNGFKDERETEQKEESK